MGATLERGASLGRYLVIDQIGQGGMGVVYSAYDPELDRRVAIKLLRSDSGGAAAAESRRMRLQREAQAMARLSHPNVITVHDVGTAGDQVFVAMELIDGVTLKRWLAERTRPWREVLATFLQAGRGLAAAHEGGLVHRDFKPDNVLVGKDGVVRVTDFGLARSAHDDDDDDAAGRQSPGAPGGKLTQTGAVMGTPAYMAPEQHRGRDADPRADQFAFCVALYEGLYGEHPFRPRVSETTTTIAASSSQAAEDLSPADALALEVVEGRIRPAPSGRDVPAWLRRALLRGLEVDPDKRWPAMDALLTALAGDPGAARRRFLAVAGALVAAAGAVTWIAIRPVATTVCTAGEARLAEVWNPPAREKLRAAFAASKAVHEGESFTRAAAGIDAYAAEWKAMHGDACRATRVTGEQSEDLLDLRMACLDRELAELGALIALLGDADAKLVDRAAGAVSKLTPVADCADVTALTTLVRPTPEQVAPAAALEVRRAQAQAVYIAGRYDKGVEPARDLVGEARALGYAPLTGEALLTQGLLLRYSDDLDGAEAAFQDAIRFAGAGRDDSTMITALVELGKLRADERSDYDGAAFLAVAAEGVLARSGGHDLQRAHILALRGDIAFYRDKFAEARDAYQAAVDLYVRVHGTENHRDILRAVNDLASSVRRDGRPLDSVPIYERGLRIQMALEGEEHPNAAAILNNLGIACMEGGDYPVALDYYHRALAIKERTLGPEHSSVTSTLQNIGNVLVEQGKLDEAEAAFQRALVIREKIMPDHLWTANTLDAIGNIRRSQGRLDEAMALHERARAIVRKAVGEEHHEMAVTLIDISTVLFDEKRYAEAATFQERALAIRRKALGAEHPDVALALGSLAETRRAEGRCDQAEPLLDEALALAAKVMREDHPDLVPLLLTAAKCRLAGGKPAEAAAFAERGLRIAEGKNARLGKDTADELRATLERARRAGPP